MQSKLKSGKKLRRGQYKCVHEMGKKLYDVVKWVGKKLTLAEKYIPLQYTAMLKMEKNPLHAAVHIPRVDME